MRNTLKHLIYLLLLILFNLCHANTEEYTEQAKLNVELTQKPHCLLMQNCSIDVSEPYSFCLAQPGSVTIQNNSKIIAKNITATSTNTNFLTYVTQNNPCPANLSPGSTCTISFTTNSSVNFLVSNIVVKGTNTNATYFDMQAIPCSAPPTTINVESPYVYIEPGPGSSAIVTVFNTGSQSAYNISASILSPQLGLTVFNSCPAQLAAGESCELILNTSTDDFGTTTLEITGLNTNTLDVQVIFTSA